MAEMKLIYLNDNL